MTFKGPSPSLDFKVSNDYKETSCSLKQGNPVKTRFLSCTWYLTFAFACYSKVRYVLVLVYRYWVRRTLYIAYLRTKFIIARYMATAANTDVRTILHKDFPIFKNLVGYWVSAIICYTPLKNGKCFGYISRLFFYYYYYYYYYYYLCISIYLFFHDTCFNVNVLSL